MTALALAPASPAAVPVVLGLQEGWRIVRHPISVVGFLLLIALIGSEAGDGPRNAFEALTIGPTFSYGVFVYFAAHLVASRDRRARSRELLAATPVPDTGRVAALSVAALVPALLALALVLAVDAANRAQGVYVVAPSAWHLLQSPLTVLGGALLGVMVARLTGVPGVALLAMAAMFAVNVWLNDRPESLQPLATFVPWAVWVEGDGWGGFHPGSPGWHVGYLLALCAMAATGAFLTSARSTARVLLVGAGFTALAGLTGLAQLP